MEIAFGFLLGFICGVLFMIWLAYYLHEKK